VSAAATSDTRAARGSRAVRSGAVLTAALLCWSWSTKAAAPAKVDFARQVRPILAENCFECHGPEPKGRKADLRLDSREAVFADRGGYHVVVPGGPDESEMILRVSAEEPDEIMPPLKSKRHLTKAQIDLLKRWVAEGASWSDHWSFIPPVRPALPEVSDASWCRNAIDRFVLAKLDAAGIKPSPAADRTTLIRRLSLDLHGLPPTPEEVDDFRSDERPDAYERLIDRLLASPRFGERWARPWLDLVRYADSDGYEDDRYRPDAWRYRDWVIAAINDDMPFDQFTIEQVAGDLLPDATLEQKTAAGFHRMAMFNRVSVGLENEEEFRVKTAKDRAATTATVWLGLTFACAECHTHKYDPLPHRDYYRFYAFFNNMIDTQAPAPPLGGKHALAYQEAVREFEAEQAQAKAALKAYETDTLPSKQAEWERSLNTRDLPPEIAAIIAVAADKRTSEQVRQLGDHFRSIDPEYVRLKAAVFDREMTANNRPPPPSSNAMTVSVNPKPRQTYVQERGDYLSSGEEVHPGTPAFLPPLQARSGEPDRLDLSRWLVDPGNPLTARVAVNELWQQLIGRGLVTTPENFGVQGDPPLHPELLDWLATEFASSGWSRKALIKLILTSSTYQQSSRFRPDLAERDPTNSLLARQNRFRVEGEVVRDVGLAVSALLNPEVGGPGVQPPLPESLLNRPEFKSERLMPPSKGDDRYRRGVYVNVQRTFAYPMLKDFDSPDPSAACPRRERSNTPLQALTLLNDPVFAECARALGLRVARECQGGPKTGIRQAFQLTLSRMPTETESEVLADVYQEHRTLYGADPKATAQLLGTELPPPGMTRAELAAWVAVARTLLNLEEFITRE
jgi:mono/diheme cytochrome c family protein